MFKLSRLLRIAFLVFCFHSTNAQTLIADGKIEGSNSTNTRVVKMLKDAGDYNYIVGTFTDSLHLDLAGGYSIYGIPNIKHGFVAKYDPWGVIQWGFALGGAADSLIIMDLNIDFNGDVLIGGSLYGTADFDPTGVTTNLTANVGADGFFAKYNPSGNLVFANLVETAGPVGAVSTIFTDGGSYIYVGGYFDVNVDVDHTGATVILNAQAGVDGYAALYDPGGVTFLDSLSFSGSGDEYVTDITSMNFGNYILVSGYFDGNIEMNSGGTSSILNSNGSNDIFIGRYNSVFDFQSAQNFGGTGNESPRDVYGNDFDFVLLAQYENTVNFNPAGFPAMNFTSAGLEDVVIAKYDFSYASLWAKSFGNAGSNIPAVLLKEATFGGAKSVNDLFTFAFNFTGTIDLDPGAGTASVTSTNTPINSAMVSLYPNGEYQSNFVIEASNIAGMTFNGNNASDVTLVGNFSGTGVDVLPYSGSNSLTHSVNNAGFFIYYNRCSITVDGTLADSYECGTPSAILTCSTAGAIGIINYYWTNGDFYGYDQTVTGASADNTNIYFIEATDEAGCIAIDSLWIYGHTPGLELDATVTPVATTCGNNFGSASASPINALGLVNYYWSNGDTTNAADSLIAATYFVQITDSLNCYVQIPFIIDNSNGPTIVINSSTDPVCGGVATGAIDITVSGGTAPYNFLWSNGTTAEDLTGVNGGTYSLVVTDAAGCENQVCLTLYQPEPLTVLLNGMLYSDCILGGGAVSVYAYGGYSPYTFLWDAAAGFQTNDTATGLISGLYTVTVTDSIGCTMNKTVGVGDASGPWVYLNASNNPTCSPISSFIDVDAFGASPFNYQWSNGSFTEDIYDIPGGEYVVLATDAFGCKGIGNFTLFQQVPYPPNLCMVTVDSTGTQNVVVFDKSFNPEAAYFNVYREGLCNSYDFGKVGFTLYDSLSVFYDTVVNTDTRSWRYYVTTVDTCGYESYPSSINRTVHLTVAFNSNYDAVLNWGAYEGFTVEDYAVYRINPAGTDFDFVDSVSSATFSFVDTIDFSGYPSQIEYYVQARTSGICFASRAFNQNSSRSNNAKAFIILDTTSSGSSVNSILEMTELIKIYPNPTNDMVTVRIDGGDGQAYQIDVMDQLGKVVKSVGMLNRTSFTTREMNNGVYFIRVKNSNGMMKTFKLIVSH